jgi:hypothetical protein
MLLSVNGTAQSYGVISERMWNRTLRDKPCSCWVKVGRGPRSLPATCNNFAKPCLLLHQRQPHRVSSFYFALKFVD